MDTNSPENELNHSRPSNGAASANSDSIKTVAALAEPQQRVNPLWVTAVMLVNIGINAAFFAPINVLLPTQAQAFDAQNKEAILGVINSAGAIVSLVANPLFGALSDRTISRFGRRVPWVFLGAVTAALALLGLAVSPSVVMMVICWCFVQLGCNGALAAITAVIPDRVPVRQRATVGGLVAMGTVLGILIGAVIGAVVAGNYSLGYVIAAVVLLLGIVMYTSYNQDEVLPQEAREVFSWRQFLQGFWISPRKHPDFAWAWLSRFLVQFGVYLCTTYLLYFLQDYVGVESPDQGVLVLTAIFSLVTLITAVIGGVLADKVGRRKPFVMVSSLLIASAALVMALIATWESALIGAALLGLGQGVYLAVDLALLTQVLPAAGSRGKDLGVINVANSLPQVFSGVLAFLMLKFFGGYVALYAFAGMMAIMGALAVLKIRSVR